VLVLDHVLGPLVIQVQALERRRDLVDAEEALLLAARDERLDIVQLDHFLQRHLTPLSRKACKWGGLGGRPSCSAEQLFDSLPLYFLKSTAEPATLIDRPLRLGS
jgi:hypothetical protein